jgi:hypothetical protein
MLVLAVLWGTADAQRIHGDGFEESCLADTDNDRLPNCEEADRGLSYTNLDTDGDGLDDGDERRSDARRRQRCLYLHSRH